MNTVNDKTLTQQKLSQYKPWTAPWMRIKFHYLDYIKDDSILSLKEKKQSNEVRQHILDVVQWRKHYRYPRIANNARDLGGYRTNNGHRVKTGYLIRSDNLHNLTKQGSKRLHQLNVTSVIDLRSIHEAKLAPDKVNPKIFHQIPVYTQKGVNRSRNKTFHYGVIYRYGTLYITNKHAQQAYYKIIKLVERTKGATLFHCVEGRDRTGIVAVLLLTALGVDEQAIIDNYMLTDYYAHSKPYIRQLMQIKHFYNTANHFYGGVMGYLHHIGITTHDIEVLRNKYVTK